LPIILVKVFNAVIVLQALSAVKKYVFSVYRTVLFILLHSYINPCQQKTKAGNTIFIVLHRRYCQLADRALALTLIAAMVSGISALITGLIAVTRQKERSPLVYIAIIIGALLMLFLAGEVLFPH
jgi:flagellar biosynthesis protein FliQ